LKVQSGGGARDKDKQVPYGLLRGRGWTRHGTLSLGEKMFSVGKSNGGNRKAWGIPKKKNQWTFGVLTGAIEWWSLNRPKEKLGKGGGEKNPQGQGGRRQREVYLKDADEEWLRQQQEGKEERNEASY